MNQSQIHPALRQNSKQSFSSSPHKGDSQTYGDGAQAGYSPLQPSPNNSYQAIQTPSYFSSTQQPHESPDGQSPTANPSDPNDIKRLRACEACRQLKVKCEPDESHPTGACKRCTKANRQCIVTAPSRKRQKKTDSRVAELEKKIDALTASLVARGGHDVEGSMDPAIAQPQLASLQHNRNPTFSDSQWPQTTRQASNAGQSPPSSNQLTGGTKRKLTNNYDYFGDELQKAPGQTFKASMPVPHFPNIFNSESDRRKNSEDTPYIDVIDRQVLDAKTAYRCFDKYVSEMCEQLPIVVFQPGTRAEDIRKMMPLLFLAVIAVAIGTIRPELQPKLMSEITRIIADRVVYRGEKSMELVQTLQVMVIFYQPPEKYEELNFNQLLHIAAVMALDIGMGKRSKMGPFGMRKGYTDKKPPMPDSNAAETRRCWLGCYFMCSNSAMSLRRPLLIRWSPYCDECLDILATAPDSLPSDAWLCHLVRAQRIAEDIGFHFSMDDPASSISLTEPKTQYQLKVFERQLSEWRDSASPDMMQKPLLQHTEAIINLYMHEIAMHHNHNIDDFKPPYNINRIEGHPDPDFVTPAHIESLTTCLRSIHIALDAFLSMELKVLRALPTLYFVRNSYAAVALIKMYSAVSATGSKFDPIFKKEDLMVELYLERLISTLTRAAEGNLSRVARKFKFIFNMLKNWHLKRLEPPSGPQRKTPGVRNAIASYNPAPLQDPNNLIWNNQAVDQNAQSQRSALQMLSDAAMVKTPSDPSNTAATLAGAGNNWPEGPTMGQMMPGISDVGVGGDGMMTYGMPGTEMDSLGFTADELTAVGNLMDDPGWFSLGLEQGGWAF